MIRTVLARLNAGRGATQLSSADRKWKHTLPDLPYDAGALEPVISREIMSLHHDKHHAAYVNNLNAAEEKLQAAVENNDIGAIISLQPALRFNGGGHVNHSIFWNNLSPNGGGDPTGGLKEAIARRFGSVDSLRSEMSAAAVGVQGSGWAWLACSPGAGGRLQLVTAANQDPVHPTTGLYPLLGFDVWEHAYYLQYQNRRADYVKELWNVVNWADVAERYAEAVSRGQ